MRRDKHSLSHYRLLTADMGTLIPTSWVEVLPGDTFRGQTSGLIRVSPLANPVMHPVMVRFHWFYVPFRIIWPSAHGSFEAFFTGGKDGQGDGSSYPTVTPTAVAEGDIGDYLGIKPAVTGLSVSELPLLAYEKIYNEYYRDQDVISEVTGTAYGDTPFKIAWEKDYFTTVRSDTQKGPDITLGTSTISSDGVFKLTADGGTSTSAMHRDASSNVQIGSVGANDTEMTYASGLQASAVAVNDFRRSFALQRYAEARQKYGSRYTEWLAYYGIRSADARLQRPEYLGGGKQTISFSEVIQTGVDSTDAGVGNLKGHGIAAMRSRQFTRFMPEHGLIMCLMSVRPKAMYIDGLHRSWSRTTKEDHYTPELAQIGMQEVYRRELYAEADAAGAGGDTVFGYQDRYAEYRHHPSTVAGEFRSTLNDWHMARSFGAAPALNASFIECDATKRIHDDQTNNTLWCMINHNLRARRMVPRQVKNRIL